MSQQEMDYGEMSRGNSGFSYGTYEEDHRYNRFGDRDKLSAPLRSSLSAGQRLILAIASLLMIMVMTFGLIGVAIATQASTWVVFPIVFILMMFTTAVIIINVVFNRRP